MQPTAKNLLARLATVPAGQALAIKADGFARSFILERDCDDTETCAATIAAELAAHGPGTVTYSHVPSYFK